MTMDVPESFRGCPKTRASGSKNLARPETPSSRGSMHPRLPVSNPRRTASTPHSRPPGLAPWTLGRESRPARGRIPVERHGGAGYPAPGRTVSTRGAWRTISRAVLPNIARATPERPWLERTIRSIPSASALSTTVRAGRP